MSRSSSKKKDLFVDKDPEEEASSRKLKMNKRLSINSQNFVMCRVGKFDQHYLITGKIGEGSFGTVYRVKHKKLHFERALKIIKKRTNLHFSSFQEIEVLKKLDHSNILKIYEFYDTPQNYYIITQIFQGQELFDYILNQQKLTEQVAAQLQKQVLRALVYTHSLKIAHRDLKPQNILLRKLDKKFKIKIIDWGLGTLMGDDKSSRICGTPEYCAPQVLKGNYSLSCDMWSIGAITYVMLTGQMPFTGKNTEDTIEVVKKGVLKTANPEFRSLSADAQNFVVRLMTKNQSKRMTASQAMQHPWIVKNAKEEGEPVFLRQTLERLKQFKLESKLGTAVISYINNHLTQEEEREKLQQIFKHLDKNSDGVLSLAELIEGYTEIYGKQVGTKFAEQTFDKLDMNHNGSLEFSEFVTFGLKRQKKQYELRLREAFDMFDRDGNGTISKEEIELILKGKSSVEMQEDIKEVIDEIDKNGDQQIDVQEFMKCVQNVYQQSKQQSAPQKTEKKKQKGKTKQAKKQVGERLKKSLSKQSIKEKSNTRIKSTETPQRLLRSNSRSKKQ